MRKTGFFVIIFVALIFASGVSFAKYSDLDGAWYPSSPATLKAELEKYLSEAHIPKIEGEIIGVLAPHAGVGASGPVAAYAYNAVSEKDPATVIIVGFSHKTYLPGKIAVLTDDSFLTPLGKIFTDQAISKKFLNYSNNFQSLAQVFDSENSIELEVPFIQMSAKNAKIVALAMCDQNKDTADILAAALSDILKNEKSYVIIASSDMCHYLPYSEAAYRDARTIANIRKFAPDEFYSFSEGEEHSVMCGYGTVYSVMKASQSLGADKVEILKYGNSGDTIGSKNSVVGYVSAVFIDSKAHGTKDEGRGTIDEGRQTRDEVKEGGMLTQTEKQELLKIARDSIKNYLEKRKKLEVTTQDEFLKQEMGAFVTLHKNGELRGCIGHMVATEPLYLTVRDMAIAAAVDDPRFPSVGANELKDIDIEISVLSPMKKVASYKDIEIPKHGVLVKRGWASGVYLPQVAEETGWSREEFLTSLCAQKAGMPADSWKTGDCELYVFTAEVFGEKK